LWIIKKYKKNIDIRAQIEALQNENGLLDDKEEESNSFISEKN